MSLDEYLVILAKRLEDAIMGNPLTKEELIYHAHELRNVAMIVMHNDWEKAHPGPHMPDHK